MRFTPIMKKSAASPSSSEYKAKMAGEIKDFDPTEYMDFKDLNAIKREFARPRKTALEDAEEIVLEAREIPEMDVCFMMDRFGYVKAQEMVQAILDSKNGIQERIGDVMKVIELYNSKNTVSSEVFVRIYYNGIQAKEDFKMALKDLLKNDDSLYNEMTYFLDSAKSK